MEDPGLDLQLSYAWTVQIYRQSGLKLVCITWRPWKIHTSIYTTLLILSLRILCQWNMYIRTVWRSAHWSGYSMCTANTTCYRFKHMHVALYMLKADSTSTCPSPKPRASVNSCSRQHMHMYMRWDLRHDDVGHAWQRYLLTMGWYVVGRYVQLHHAGHHVAIAMHVWWRPWHMYTWMRCY